MDSAVTVAVVGLAGVVAASLVGPGVLSVLLARQRRAETIRAEERQDRVAAAAAEQARLQAARQQEVAQLLLDEQRAIRARTDEVARLAAESDERTAAKLEAIDAQGRVIHALVNEKLTTVTQRALLATVALLPYLEEGVARMRAGGVTPSAADLRRLEDTKRSIVELRATLSQRVVQQAEADAAAESSQAAPPV